jgi:hypothetical protein
LFQREYFPGDQYFENIYPLQKRYESTKFGFTIRENRLITDEKNNILSHAFIDQLENESDVEKFTMPVVTAFPEEDAQSQAILQEVLGDILRVELRGGTIYYAPWDQIVRYRGVTPMLTDLVDRPEHLHSIMEHYTQCATSELEQMLALNLLDPREPSLHCTPALTKDLPTPEYVPGEKPQFKDLWFRSMAQIFSDVSSDMHEEFDLQYGKRLAERCGLTYYGCCERLDRKIPILKKNFPNLRKIGVSPWADEEKSAEQIGGDYVYARKPNPATVALKTDVETVRAEIKKTVELCLKYSCPYELVLKDISTVSYNPQNLILWEKTVRETLDEYYS